LPPLIGSVMAEHHLSAEGLTLFIFLFVWQIPHFPAIGWLHREDYQRAGFQVLAVRDPKGSKSGFIALVFSTLLLVITVGMSVAMTTESFDAGHFGLIQLSLFAAPMAMMFYAHRMFSSPSRSSARRLFLASNVALLITMTALVAVSLVRLTTHL